MEPPPLPDACEIALLLVNETLKGGTIRVLGFCRDLEFDRMTLIVEIINNNKLYFWVLEQT